MTKEKNTGKSILAAGAAAAICGAALYAVGQTLSFLFRDVDPKRLEKSPDMDEVIKSNEAFEEEDVDYDDDDESD